MPRTLKSVLIALATSGALLACTTTTVTRSGGGDIISSSQQAGAPRQEVNARSRAQARVDLAAGYFSNGQMSVALEEARRAVQMDPTFADAYGLLGLIYMQLDDRREAEANFSRALQLDPSNPDINNNYGWFLCQQPGRERDAVAYFQRAIRDPMYSTPARANLSAGVCLMRVKDYSAAEPYLRRSLELDAASATTKYELARMYLATGQIDRASFYYGLLSKSTEATPATLWLGLKIARNQGDLRTETALSNALRNMYPASTETGWLARGAYDE
jgi:type IV pilus assembly protein PilF